MRLPMKALAVACAVTVPVSLGTTASADRAAADGDSYLLAVTAVGQNSAWAVGSESQSGGRYAGLVEHWDGQAWSTVLKYLPADRDGGWLEAVDATDDQDVWAVGTTVHRSEKRAMVVHWDGTRWRPVDLGGLALGADSQLDGIAAVSPSHVWLVGSSRRLPSSKDEPLALHWDGTTMTRVATPAPRGQGQLVAVSATSASDVWAVGDTIPPNLGNRTLIEHWDGASWQVVTAPNLPGDLDYPEAVYASAPGEAWAVGFSSHGPLLLRKDNGPWKYVHLPKADAGFEFFGISGTSDDDVWIVGEAHGARTDTVTLHWDGNAWTRVHAPTQRNENINGVAAGGPGATWMVGGYLYNRHDEHVIRDLWTGEHWVAR